MNRLTKYKPRVDSMFPYVLKDDELITELDSIHKLGLLEDLEEELGIDFITLVKMLKDNVYINTGGVVGEIGNIYKEQIRSIEHWPVWGFTVGDNVEYAFKDRGKTWALDKEEFYKNIK